MTALKLENFVLSEEHIVTNCLKAGIEEISEVTTCKNLYDNS
jgi:hypothetical protein